MPADPTNRGGADASSVAAPPSPSDAASAGWAPDPLDDASEALEEPEGAAASPLSVFDNLKRQYAQAATERTTVKMIVPGRFNNSLAGRFRPVPFDETRKRAKRMARRGETPESELKFMAEVIAESCEEILVRPQPGADLVSMGRELGLAAPVRFDETLREALGIDTGDIEVDESGTVRLVFKNPEALTTFFGELTAWFREEWPEDDEADPT